MLPILAETNRQVTFDITPNNEFCTGQRCVTVHRKQVQQENYKVYYYYCTGFEMYVSQSKTKLSVYKVACGINKRIYLLSYEIK